MKNTTSTSRRTKKTTTTTTPTQTSLTRGQVEEVVDEMLREAFRDHSRNIEQHLKNIHARLVQLETQRAKR